MLYLCEPRFVPERFFQRHPALRGPRVDNPTCSKTPLYALCTDLPEVLDHYREMMAKIMELVPDLAMASLFTSDSGAGFDYNPDQYAGPNGAGFNRGIPLEKRVARFLRALLDAGRAVNPDFTVNVTSGFPTEMRAKILALCPPGVVGSVYGLYDWEGGLEEHWGYHQAVWGMPKAKWTIRNLDRAAAAADRFADMQKRFDVAAQGGREPIVHAELPTTDYPRPLRYTPHPFETIRLMKDLARLGAKRIAAWGVISPKSLVPHEPNERNRDHVIHELYAKHTLPELFDAAETLVRESARATGEAAKVLKHQSEHVRLAWLYMRSHYNWYEAGRYLAPADQPGRDRAMPQIVADEIQVTQETIALIEGRAERFLRIMPSDFMTYEFGPGFVGQLKQRISVMQSHRNDLPRSLSDRLGKLHAYMKSLSGEEL
ncbi:MAG: hypothetical protein HY360_04060 [Verrucomicrobia bacterium]|nr:hypothetical protein [Verrucomicrobiota bacterium]